MADELENELRLMTVSRLAPDNARFIVFQIWRGDDLIAETLREEYAREIFAALRNRRATPEPSGAYLVWSNEHGAWWRPNSAGYTTHVGGAGRYSRDAAVSIARTARDGWGDPAKTPTEIPVREDDILAALRAANKGE